MQSIKLYKTLSSQCVIILSTFIMNLINNNNNIFTNK